MSKDIEALTFNEFCYKYCKGLYDPKFPLASQSTGYLNLRKMVIEGIKPASLEEIERWKTNPTEEELIAVPHIKYLQTLHFKLRPFIINNWGYIEKMSTLNKSKILKRMSQNMY